MAEQNTFVFKFATSDYVIMFGYMAMLVSSGLLVKNLCKDVKDYFIGGNRVSWWLAGASCFMMSFSAWTFTGAAGFAYENGILIIFLFMANVFAYFFMGLFIAHKCRQTRRITWIEIVEDRFGKTAAKFFTAIQVPMMLFGGAIWLSGLATFLSVAFGWPIEVTIIVSGVVILTYSTIAGSWGVMTADFLQTIILMALTIVIAVLTISKLGSVGAIVERLDPQKLQVISTKHPITWIAAYFCNFFFISSSLIYSPRYLSVRDGINARKAAFLAAGLFLVGPVVWFIPPIAASIFFPDIAALLPGLSHPQDAAYVLMGLDILPKGLAGLLIMVIFAATLSSMDVAINQNAAIICMNIYKPFIRKNASPKELFVVAHISNVIFGMCVILAALVFTRQKELSLFDLMLMLLKSVTLPISVPLVLVYWIKRAPKFSAVFSSIVGLIYSLLASNFDFIAGPHVAITQLINKTGIVTLDPVQEWPFGMSVGGVIILGSAAFMLSTLFWKNVSNNEKSATHNFYEKMNHPIEDAEIDIQQDKRQFMVSGILAIIAGLVIASLCVVQVDWKSRITCIAVGFMVFVAGVLLRFLAKQKKHKMCESIDPQQTKISYSLNQETGVKSYEKN
ncbi:MAG: hypothetical protein A2Y10_17620 [Planctomycetes bacterium GWF2_41_51]|nr:MAG: hypothetical protein A2Y10_17620 [Planctomycetes bacterium GWF2_41_51]HBG28046.1 hypothetical protein [Phycisphaerales bacterium]